MTSSKDNSCKVTGTVGVIVQLALAVLVLVVLITEYVVENLNYHFCGSSHKPRKLRTFWFDSFKICTGALVSHAFNILVSVLVTNAADSNECAVYALTFYYEACGVPFVQLLQYGVIQYARRMARQPDINKSCKTQWNYIASPGIYAKHNRYNLQSCLKFEDCNDRRLLRKKITFTLLIIIAVLLSVGAAWLFIKIEGESYSYIDVSVIILVFIFCITATVAPTASLIQTFGWVCVKITEKTVWSILALIQTTQFAEWSLAMGTGSSTKDAWLFIAIIPIVMNAFMFFMFSRISRLKIPCLDVKIRHQLDDKLEQQDANDESTSNFDNINNNNYNNNNNNNNNYNQQHNIIDVTNQNQNQQQTQNQNLTQNIHNQNYNSNTTNNNNLNEQFNNNSDTTDSFMTQTPSDIGKFDVREAIKVGVIYTLMVNITLLVIAIIYLSIQKGDSVYILGLTMVLAPLVIAGIGILIFKYLIDGSHNIFGCCCKVNQYSQMYNRTGNGNGNSSYENENNFHNSND